MISINTSTTAKLTDRPISASTCSLGLSASAFQVQGTGMSGFAAVRPLALPAALPVRERNERPTKALEAGVAAAEATAYACAATGAEHKQQTQHHTMWAFRGLEPWSDPA
ncbi:hypothetical protein NX801_01685 [Streptomyces sp. LP05-1]|uniref:Uncharacterized protein n=1 Tax=Streptomyces pyxinae TaxID=2970734 RepID=A0ABT2CBB0_9ACTN|nr:hypothetical protein [Streptomyces sp. LP05-1]MCS0634397.1 hypothetical protein [Streptomyces sp. LP05-1]